MTQTMTVHGVDVITHDVTGDTEHWIKAWEFDGRWLLTTEGTPDGAAAVSDWTLIYDDPRQAINNAYLRLLSQLRSLNKIGPESTIEVDWQRTRVFQSRTEKGSTS